MILKNLSIKKLKNKSTLLPYFKETKMKINYNNLNAPFGNLKLK